MNNKLPLVIFENDELIYANFAIEKIFDRHSFLLKGMKIENMFKRTTINAIERLNCEGEITVHVKNGDSYTAAASKTLNLKIIKFLHPNGEIPKTVVNLKTDNSRMYEYILDHSKTKIDKFIDTLDSGDDGKKQELKAAVNKFCDNLSDLIYEIKSSVTPTFEIFEICEVVRNVIDELRTEKKAKISLVTKIGNGYVTGDKEKFIPLLKQLLTLNENTEVLIFEDSDSIKISIASFKNERVEFSDTFFKSEAEYLWRIFANEAGCKIFSQNADTRGNKNIIIFETTKTYRVFDKDPDIYIEQNYQSLPHVPLGASRKD